MVLFTRLRTSNANLTRHISTTIQSILTSPVGFLTDLLDEKKTYVFIIILAVHCVMPQNQTTPEKTLSNPFFGKGFCEPGQYKSAIQRCETGYHSLEMGIDMYKSLQKVFETFSTGLEDWAKSSIKEVSNSKESGCNKLALLKSIRAVEELKTSNDEIVNGIKTDVVGKMNDFKNTHYGKSFLRVRQIREFEKEFKKTQETWIDCLKKISEAKQTYHDAAKKLDSAEGALKVTQSDVGSSPEDKKKAEKSVQRYTEDKKSCLKKYESALKDMEPKRVTYEEKMLKTLKETDDFETKRLEHFKSIIESLQKSIVIQRTDFDKKLNDEFAAAVKEHNSVKDIEFFNENYGSGKKTVWPVFEEYKPDRPY